jgi:TRAP-type mannitol/chloroaromatic compound transport system substrate-binding protein
MTDKNNHIRIGQITMKKSAKMVLTSTAVAVTLATIAAQPAFAADKKVLLKVPVAFSTNLPSLGSPILKVADNLDLISNKNVRMKIYEPGKLVAPFEILESVSAGKVNAGFTLAGYWAGKIPASPIFSSVPFGPEASEYLAWIYYGNGLNLYQEMYDQAGYNVHVVPCGITPPETSGWFAKPIEKPEDLQGLRMRFFGLGGKVMEKLGVSTSLLPGSEIFPALEKGAIDATEFSIPAVDKNIGFHKIVKYNYFPGWHQQATLAELLINKDEWNGMSENQQAQINQVCKASVTDSLAQGEAEQFKVMKENVEKRGVVIKQWSPEMLRAFKTAWDEVVMEETARDPFFAKVWTDLSEFRQGYSLWGDNAFLPR